MSAVGICGEVCEWARNEDCEECDHNCFMVPGVDLLVVPKPGELPETLVARQVEVAVVAGWNISWNNGPQTSGLGVFQGYRRALARRCLYGEPFPSVMKGIPPPPPS